MPPKVPPPCDPCLASHRSSECDRKKPCASCKSNGTEEECIGNSRTTCPYCSKPYTNLLNHWNSVFQNETDDPHNLHNFEEIRASNPTLFTSKRPTTKRQKPKDLDTHVNCPYCKKDYKSNIYNAEQLLRSHYRQIWTGKLPDLGKVHDWNEIRKAYPGSFVETGKSGGPDGDKTAGSRAPPGVPTEAKKTVCPHCTREVANLIQHYTALWLGNISDPDSLHDWQEIKRLYPTRFKEEKWPGQFSGVPRPSDFRTRSKPPEPGGTLKGKGRFAAPKPGEGSTDAALRSKTPKPGERSKDAGSRSKASKPGERSKDAGSRSKASKPDETSKSQQCPYCHAQVPHLTNHFRYVWNYKTADPLNLHDFRQIKEDHKDLLTGDRPEPPDNFCRFCGKLFQNLPIHYQRVFLDRARIDPDGLHDIDQIAAEYPNRSIFQRPRPEETTSDKPTTGTKTRSKRKRLEMFYCKHFGCDHEDDTYTKHLSHMRGCLKAGPRPHPCRFRGCPISEASLKALAEHERQCSFRDRELYEAGALKIMRDRAIRRPWPVGDEESEETGRPCIGATRLRCRVLDCTETSLRLTELDAHLLRDHSGDDLRVAEFRCAMQGCGAAFQRAHQLSQHLQCHDSPSALKGKVGRGRKHPEWLNLSPQFSQIPERAYHKIRCSFVDCEQSYFSQDQLELHLRTHLPSEAPAGYRCPCGEYHDTVQDLWRHLFAHMKTLSGKGRSKYRAADPRTRYICVYCSTSFNSNAAWLVHSCAPGHLRCNRRGCLRSFSTLAACQYHLRVCDKALPTVTEAEKRWACRGRGCTQAFSSIGSRNAHERTCTFPRLTREPAIIGTLRSDPVTISAMNHDLLVALNGRISIAYSFLRKLGQELNMEISKYQSGRDAHRSNMDDVDPSLRPTTPTTSTEMSDAYSQMRVMATTIPSLVGEANQELENALDELHLPNAVSEALQGMSESSRHHMMDASRGIDEADPVMRSALHMAKFAGSYILVYAEIDVVLDALINGPVQTQEDGDPDEGMAEEDRTMREDTVLPDDTVLQDETMLDADEAFPDRDETVVADDEDDGEVEDDDAEYDEDEFALQQAILDSLSKETEEEGDDAVAVGEFVPRKKLKPKSKEEREAEHTKRTTEANASREAEFRDSIQTQLDGVLTIGEQQYFHTDVIGDGNCMDRAFSALYLGSEHRHPQLRGELQRHIRDVFQASDDLDLSAELRELYIALDEQSRDAGEASLIDQILYDGAWGTIELAQVFAILFRVEVVVHMPQHVEGSPYPQWQLLARGHPGSPQIHLVCWPNTHHWTALSPLPGSPLLDTGNLQPSARSPIDLDDEGAQIPPMLSPQHFVRRTLPSINTIGAVERTVDEEQGDSTNVDSDLAASYTTAMRSEKVKDTFKRLTLPKSPPLARLLEISNVCGSDELINGAEFMRRSHFDFVQFGKFRVIDRREYAGERTEAEEELTRQMATASFEEVAEHQALAELTDTSSIVIDWTGQPATDLDDESPPSAYVIAKSQDKEQMPVKLRLDGLLLTRSDARFLQQFGAPDPTWLLIGRFSDLRSVNDVALHLASQQQALNDCRAAIWAEEANDPNLHPRIGPQTGRVRSFWINGKSAADFMPVYDSPFVIPEHLAILTELNHNDMLMPRPIVYCLVRSISGWTVSPSWSAIRARWPLLTIRIYFAIRDAFRAAAGQGVMGPLNINFTPRSPIGMYYNREPVDLDDLVAAEQSQGNGPSPSANSIWHLLQLELKARIGGMPWQPDCVDVFIRSNDRNGWQ